MDLRELLETRKDELLLRWENRARVVFDAKLLTHRALADSFPDFVAELAYLLGTSHKVESERVVERSIPKEHGRQRFALGFNVMEVVRDYDLLHECIICIAEESGLTLRYAEIAALNRAFSSAAAEAILEYNRQREQQLNKQEAQHLSFIAHELRNPLGSARLAFDVMRKKGLLSAESRTAENLKRGLDRMAERIDNTLVEGKLRAGLPIERRRMNVKHLLDDACSDSVGQAESGNISITVEADPLLALSGDPRLLESAITNLVRNAVKFTKVDGRVIVRARRAEGATLIEVEDRCGGLPPGLSERLFAPFVQRDADRRGFGLGLAIARQAAEEHGGALEVRDLPGKGCVFVMEIPRNQDES